MTSEFIHSDGYSRLVIERDPDGRTRFSVHDRERPGFTVTVSRTDLAAVAEFIKEGQ
jgi:hypothetical protein